jgi:hypothetical protein
MFRIISYSDKPTHQLFTGHRGCGKSTELLRLKKRLEGDGFYVVYFAADEDLDANDLTYTDLLLSIARRVIAQTSKDEINLGDALKTVETWFAEVVYEQSEWRSVEQELTSQAEIGLSLPKGIPLIGRVLTRLTEQIKTGDEIKKQIRQRLDSKIPQLIGGLNDLLNRADVEVQRAGQKAVAVIVDNLDRVTRKDLGDGRTSHDALFIEHGDQLCALRCHTIYTVPISMMYGLSARDLSGIEEARRLYGESLEIKKRLGDQSGVAITLHRLGRLAEEEGDKAEAARPFREALSIFERLGSPDAEIARESLARVEGNDVVSD